MNKSLSLSKLCPNELPHTTGLKSGLTDRCKKIFNKKIDELNSEDLRLLLGQNIALEIIVPHTLSILENDPLISGELYKGDLLSMLLSIPKEFWSTHKEFNNRLVEIKIEIEDIYETLTNDIIPKLRMFDYSIDNKT